jgi:hypothetical protein
LLTVARLYSERTMTHPVLFRDVARGVARLYELPDQSPTQMIDEKLAEEIGVDKTITFNKTITFEDVVKDSTLWLRNHGLAEVRNDVVRLTEAGSDKAKNIVQQQWIVDLGITDRIARDPQKASKYHPRLFRPRDENSPTDLRSSGPEGGASPPSAKPAAPPSATSKYHPRLFRPRDENSPTDLRSSGREGGVSPPSAASRSPAPDRGPSSPRGPSVGGPRF